jgi:hypothetical protein
MNIDSHVSCADPTVNLPVCRIFTECHLIFTRSDSKNEGLVGVGGGNHFLRNLIDQLKSTGCHNQKTAHWQTTAMKAEGRTFVENFIVITIVSTYGTLT